MVFDCRKTNRRQSLRREQNVDVGEQHLKHFHFRLKKKLKKKMDKNVN